MSFLQIIGRKKFTLIGIFLFIYVILNLLDGQRGLISYFEKKIIINDLLKEKNALLQELNSLENKNNLLTNVIDTDYLETLYRKKFLVGKVNEKLYLK